MLKRIAAYGLVLMLVFGPVRPARAVDLVWDDEGGSADKTWSNLGNWSPDNLPDDTDDLFIGVNQLNANIGSATNDSTVLDQRFVVNSITTGNGADITNSDDGGTTVYELQVDQDTEIGNGTGTSLLNLYGNPILTQESLDTNTLTINDGGRVNMFRADGVDAVLQVDNGVLDINTGGELSGAGVVELTDLLAGPTDLLVNDGEITANTPTILVFQAPTANTLQITASDADATFDWDGIGGLGVLNVNGNQTMDIDVDTGGDAFGGTMNLSTGSTIDIEDAWSLNTGTINVNTAAFGLIIIGQDPNPGAAAVIDGADWTMSGGTVNIGDAWDSLQLDSQLVASGGTIENSGTMIFNDGATIQSGVDFNMNGAGAALIVNSAVNIDTPDFNLDGTASVDNITTINAGGNLDLDLGAGADESFNHTINLNGTGTGLNEAELDVTTDDNNWELASNAQINVAGGGTSRINGETFQANGDIDVSGNSTLIVGASTEYGPSASVTVEAGSTVNMGSATYDGGSYTGAGVFKKGTATVLTSTAWNVGTVDIDDGTTTVNNGAALVVNTDSIDDSGDGIDSTITVEDTGTLAINLSDGSDVVFDSAGRLNYNGNIISSTFLPTTTGSALAFSSGSELNINGDGTSDARIKLNGGTLNINDVGEDFRMNGGSLVNGDTNEISGGTVNGPGELQIGAGRALRGNGTIDTQVDGDGTAQLIASSGTLNVNGGIEDIGTLGTSGGAAVLNVSTPWNTNVTDAVVLNGGTLQGSTITNDGGNGIVGGGTVLARVDNNSLINATGNLIVQNNLNDWDGAANTGVLRASGGTLELRDNASFLFNGTVQANNGTVFANNFELEFDPASQMTLNQGTYRSNRATDFGGNIDVAAGGTSIIQVFGASSTFEAGSTTTLNDTLRLEDGASFVEVGATFAGGGVLQNAASHVLTLEDGANVGVLVENEGRLELGASPGQATVLDYEQTPLGVLEIELEGTGLSDFDRLTATGLMQLDGLLELSLLGGFNPMLNDTFTILSAAAGVNGVFSGFDFSSAPLDAGLAWNVIYNPTNVQLAVTEMPMFTADFDMDGDVDEFDLAQWEGDYGGPGSDANGDGTSSGTDFLAWQQQNGSGAAIAAIGAAAVPEPSTLLLGGFAATLGLLVSRRKK